MKTITQKIGWVTGLLGLSMFFASLVSIWLARSLSTQAFGEFSLMRSLILFLPTLAIWGQDIAVTTFFARDHPGRYQWTQLLRRVLFASAVIGAISVVVSGLIYDLKPYQWICLLLAILITCSTLLLSSLFRSMRRYRTAVLMSSAFRGLFLFVVAFLWATKRLGADTAIIGYTLTLLVTGLFNIYLAHRSMPIGKDPVPAELHKTGLIYMGIGLVVNVLVSLDALVISKVLGNETLAIFSATTVPAQIFSIISHAAKIVWVPEFGRSVHVSLNAYGRKIIVLAFFLMIAVAAAAQPIMRLLYDGKYDSGIFLLQILSLAGLLRLINGLSSSFIMGRFTDRGLAIYLAITLTIMLFYIPGLYFALRGLGVIGAGYALAVQLAIRVAVGYFLIGYGGGRQKPWLRL
ncbi:MAG TPA: hypothetical protein PKN04_05285 [bacterium]|nr:hypothetical protein [bacterium]HNT65176.1 hypothetical protein [bacterium]